MSVQHFSSRSVRSLLKATTWDAFVNRLQRGKAPTSPHTAVGLFVSVNMRRRVTANTGKWMPAKYSLILRIVRPPAKTQYFNNWLRNMMFQEVKQSCQSGRIWICCSWSAAVHMAHDNRPPLHQDVKDFAATQAKYYLDIFVWFHANNGRGRSG